MCSPIPHSDPLQWSLVAALQFSIVIYCCLFERQYHNNDERMEYTIQKQFFMVLRLARRAVRCTGYGHAIHAAVRFKWIVVFMTNFSTCIGIYCRRIDMAYAHRIRPFISFNIYQANRWINLLTVHSVSEWPSNGPNVEMCKQQIMILLECKSRSTQMALQSAVCSPLRWRVVTCPFSVVFSIRLTLVERALSKLAIELVWFCNERRAWINMNSSVECRCDHLWKYRCIRSSTKSIRSGDYFQCDRCDVVDCILPFRCVRWTLRAVYEYESNANSMNWFVSSFGYVRDRLSYLGHASRTIRFAFFAIVFRCSHAIKLIIIVILSLLQSMAQKWNFLFCRTATRHGAHANVFCNCINQWMMDVSW